MPSDETENDRRLDARSATIRKSPCVTISRPFERTRVVSATDLSADGGPHSAAPPARPNARAGANFRLPPSLPPLPPPSPPPSPPSPPPPSSLFSAPAIGRRPSVSDLSFTTFPPLPPNPPPPPNPPSLSSFKSSSESAEEMDWVSRRESSGRSWICSRDRTRIE